MQQIKCLRLKIFWWRIPKPLVSRVLLNIETKPIPLNSYVTKATVHAGIKSLQAAETNQDAYGRHRANDDHDVCRGTFLVSQTQNLSSEFKSVAKQQQTLIICAETV